MRRYWRLSPWRRRSWVVVFCFCARQYRPYPESENEWRAPEGDVRNRDVSRRIEERNVSIQHVIVALGTCCRWASARLHRDNGD